MSARDQSDPGSARLSRRHFLGGGTLAVAGLMLPEATFAAGTRTVAAVTGQQATTAGDDVVEASIATLQARMHTGQLTARQLVQKYIERIAAIDQSGPMLRSVLEINPDALSIADALDAERRERGPRGPLHGIPILLKDNIDTADGMLTTAGSLALVGTRPRQDATVARRLRDAGAILLGKTNLSEWANFRGFNSSSGWSARGGQGRNPYALDRNPCGSSSGSAQAVAASLAAAALGTETDGSIVCPSSACGVVGIKPTVGLTSRAGVIPIAHSQDTVGPHARTVADAAAVLGALVGVDPRDQATAGSAGKFHNDYTQFLDRNGLRGARIGVVRSLFGFSTEADHIANSALGIMQYAGATLLDPVEIPSFAETGAMFEAEFEVLLYEFKHDLNAYLATREPNPRYPNAPVVRTLADAIAFNEATRDVELKYFGQEIFLISQDKGPLTEQGYLDALETGRRIAATEGIDAVMDRYELDALVAPTGSPAWPIDLVNGDHFLGGTSGHAAVAGYPLVNVTAGYAHGLPVGISLMGRAYSEPTLIKLAYAFEQVAQLRRPPQYIPSLSLNRRRTRR